MKSIVRNNLPIFDISKVDFTNKDLKNFRKEIIRTIKFGLFPFAFEFKISAILEDKNNFSFQIICQTQGIHGNSEEFNIKSGDIFNFSFQKKDQEFTHFSTNISSQLFTILLISCDKTSQKLFLCLQNTDYAIANKTPEIINRYLKKIFPDKKITEELIAYIFENIDKLIHPNPDSQRNLGRTLESAISRSKIAINIDELENPLNKKRCDYIAKYEIIPQLIEAKIFEELQNNPTIIDIGSADGLNIIEIKKHFPNCTIFGIEPRKNESIKANRIGILTYNGFVEDLINLEGKADLVTVFNSNPRSNATNFYYAIKKLLKTNGKALIGINSLDSPITSNGKTIEENLNMHFKNVTKLENPQNFIQDFYIAK